MRDPRWIGLAISLGLAGCGKSTAPTGVGSAASATSSAAVSSALSCAPGLSKAPRDGWVSLAIAGSVACAVHGTGRVACWGPDAVGRGTAWLPCSEPAWIDGLTDVTTLTAGGTSAMCARTSKGEVSCWGLGPWGKTASGFGFAPARAPELDGRTLSMAPGLGGQHACAFDAKGQLECWGFGAVGQVGRPDPESKYLPAAKVLAEVSAVAAAPTHTCAIVRGSVFCWGYGEQGALGDGDLHERPCHIETAPHTGPGLPGHYRKCEGPEPVFTTARPVVGISGGRHLDATALVAGHARTCALVGRAVKCWGKGFGASPRDMGVADAVAIAGDDLFCARNAAGDVFCFDESSSGAVSGPRKMLGGATAIAASSGRVCGVLAGGHVRCAGRNVSGLPLDDWTVTP